MAENMVEKEMKIEREELKLNPETTRLLKIRSKLKNSKPKFVRQESWRYKRIKSRWRSPRGIDSKMRYKYKAYPKQPGSGYGSPRKVRGLHPSGLEEVSIYNVDDLSKIDVAKQGARIAHAVSARKRMAIIEKAKELGIRILNLKEVKALEPKDSEKIGS